MPADDLWLVNACGQRMWSTHFGQRILVNEVLVSTRSQEYGIKTTPTVPLRAMRMITHKCAPQLDILCSTGRRKAIHRALLAPRHGRADRRTHRQDVWLDAPVPGCGSLRRVGGQVVVREGWLGGGREGEGGGAVGAEGAGELLTGSAWQHQHGDGHLGQECKEMQKSVCRDVCSA